MSNLQNKYVIGLTGNIASGKSLVRNILENLGAFSIDTDSLGHRVLLKDGSGFQRAVQAFGDGILKTDGNINRSSLAAIVFNDSAALSRLESIIHPPVFQAVDLLIKRAIQPVVVLESIALLETDLKSKCDEIWVVTSSREVRLERLVEQRGLSQSEAAMRIDTQSPQEEKPAKADVVIQNDGNFQDIFQQVVKAWLSLNSKMDFATVPTIRNQSGKLVIRVADISDFPFVQAFVNNQSTHQPNENSAYLNHSQSYLLLEMGGRLYGVAVWQTNNLLCLVTDLFLEPGLSSVDIVPLLIRTMEQAAKRIQCEAILYFLPSDTNKSTWLQAGYQDTQARSLPIPPWRDIAIKLLRKDSLILFKQLEENLLLLTGSSTPFG